jgi:hypothetical protein
MIPQIYKPTHGNEMIYHGPYVRSLPQAFTRSLVLILAAPLTKL